LGVDPGTAVTGYGVVEAIGYRKRRLVECGVIRTRAGQDVGGRLSTLYDGIVELITRHSPSAVAVESAFYHKNVRTTVTLGQARGVVLLAAARAGLEVSEFPPATVKKSIVGEGQAVKKQVAFMVQRILRLKEPPAPDDAADACAIALTYLMTAKANT
jgi:crossover junction endodeoxyribonuclease RuvC